ncbi:MAG: N-acetyltransferase [Planctomycetota bacterium]
MRNLNFRYYKRYRMELDLRGWRRPALAVRPEYRLTPWSPELVYEHAEVKYLSFRDTVDSVVFPCLGELTTCLRLMQEIRDRSGFLPEATWLAVHVGGDGSLREPCGTIQAIRAARGRANIQNIGVTPSHRGRGIGAGLILAACAGLQQVGVSKALLEVTAENELAVRLYRRLGFRVVRTLYKAVDPTISSPTTPTAGCR